MCGVAGFFGAGHENDDVRLRRLKLMGNAIAHRGPDGEGFWLDASAALVHRRLAIIGLASGSQPMLSSNGRVVISFNGEIYNYKELRSRLLTAGYRFNTASDTEVILALYLSGGVKAFNQMRGMFAFALWDTQENTGYLVRDPMGIKPLFFRNSPGARLEFASEAKAILAGAESAGVLDEIALHKLMNFRYLPDQTSLFRGIAQIPPGGIFRWKEGEFCREVDLSSEVGGNTSEILASIEQSVAYHTVADVEVAGYLSGGIDSAIVVALAKRQVPGRFRTFTLDVGDDPQEAKFASETASMLGVENLVAPMETEPNYLVKLIRHLEVPKVNSLQVGLLARHASRHVKVALSGLGGDELFLGYNAHAWMAKTHFLRQHFETATSAAGSFAHFIYQLGARQYWTERERALLVAKHISRPSSVYGLFRNVWDSEAARREIYGPRMLAVDLPPMFDWLDGEWPHNDDPVLAMREFEWNKKLVNDLLWQEDRCSMAHGLEVRVPFVDVVVKKSCWQLSRRELMLNGEKKGLLKNAFSPILSSSILNRRKSGFQVDAPTFFRNQLASLSEHYLSPELVKKTGLFNPKFVENVLKLDSKKQNRWHFFMLYLMLSTHIWIDVFEGGGSAGHRRI